MKLTECLMHLSKIFFEQVSGPQSRRYVVLDYRHIRSFLQNTYQGCLRHFFRLPRFSSHDAELNLPNLEVHNERPSCCDQESDR